MEQASEAKQANNGSICSSMPIKKLIQVNSLVVDVSPYHPGQNLDG
jgi:hypothetical protein